MRRFCTLLSMVTFMGIFSPVRSSSQAAPKPDSPAFNSVPELEKGYRLMYEQKFPEAREVLMAWAAENPTEPFGQVSVGASYLFEEFYLQQVLTSDYFLNDKRFLGGITGTPDPVRMKAFQDSIAKARTLANQRMKKHPRDPEALFVLALCAGMQSDADSMLMKKHYDALKMLKEANSNAEMLLKEHPDTYDIYVAPGIAYYVIGSLSSSARFVLWFGGIHGDRQLGMSQVQKTADNGNYLKPFAQILLALSARRERQDELAQKNLKELTEEFPGNSTYAAEYAKAMGRPIPSAMVPAN
jgi:outer membrane protein assembly factor BamD (BamD/ComL family)